MCSGSASCGRWRSTAASTRRPRLSASPPRPSPSRWPPWSAASAPRSSARSTRGVTLTQAGQIMVGAAESVAAELEHAQQQVDRLSTGRAQLTVATFTSGGRLLLPAALARLMAAHPRTVSSTSGRASPRTPCRSSARAPWTSPSPTTSTARCPSGRARAPAWSGHRSWRTPCTSSCRKGTDSPTATRSTSPSWQPNPGCSAA